MTVGLMRILRKSR